MLGDLLHWSRTPLLIPGDEGGAFDPLGPALIAWDGSYQAANAVRASLGLLKLAPQVRVLRVEEKKMEAFPGTKLVEYLSRHGIHADMHVEPISGSTEHQLIAAALLGHSEAMNASYMVLGAYSHSRIGEYVFGGVTRTLLSSSPVALVMAR
jgi:nucleotide-binding universal stress UspA family protein